jgi:nucleoside 2-deoxyribosyltransferase
VKVRREKNPFSYKSGEAMTPEEVKQLFSDPPGFETYKNPSKHCIIVGSKGSGKSILLKSLSVQVQSSSKKMEELDYYGIYIGRVIDTTKFVEQNKKFETTDVFEHFFSLLIIAEITDRFSEVLTEEINKKSTGFFNKRFIEKLNLLNDNQTENFGFKPTFPKWPPNNLKEISNYIREKLQDLLNQLSPERSKPEEYGYSSFWKLNGLLQFLRDFYNEIKPFSIPRLCLLIDDFQDLEELGTLILNNFLRHENLGFLTVKIGTRRTYFDMASLDVEYERDFDILILDCDPNNPDHIEFFRKFANRKIMVEWELTEKEMTAINIDTLLPDAKPEEIRDWESEITPAGNFSKIGIIEAEQSKRNLRQKCFQGFNCIAKVSMVNPFVFLEICQSAYEEQQKHSINITSPKIEAKAQSEALIKKSRRYRDVGISSKKDYSEYFLGIRSFICNTANHLEKRQMQEQFEGTKMSIPVEEIDLLYLPLIREAILSRDLFVNKKESLIALIFNPATIPSEIELNRLICPSYGISWESNGHMELSIEEVKDFIEKPLKGDPDSHPFGVISKQKELFDKNELLPSLIPEYKMDIPWVFGSGPYVETHKERVRKIKKTVTEIRKEKLKDSGRTYNEEDVVYLDVWTLRDKYAGNYKEYIFDAISKSMYVVSDITGFISTGVAYETGLAIGIGKPFFLFWDVKDIGRTFKSEDKKEWHPFLQEHDVREWDKEKNRKKGITFKEWYWKNIDKHGVELSGHLECILKGFLPDKKCEFKDLIKSGINKVYISCQTQNKNAEEIIINILSERYNLYPILHSDIPNADPVCFKCAAIKSSKIQIIDVSARKMGEKGDPCFALELGFAYARHKNQTKMIFDADLQSNPVEMFPGKSCGWHSATIEKNLEENLEEFMKSFNDGGMKK